MSTGTVPCSACRRDMAVEPHAPDCWAAKVIAHWAGQYDEAGEPGRRKEPATVQEPWPADPVTSASSAPDRTETIVRIRAALRRRTGRTWSVTGGRGTSWGWIRVTAPPARLDEHGSMTDEDRAILTAALGLDSTNAQGELIPAGSDYRTEYVDRAEGRQPSRIGEPYWD